MKIKRKQKNLRINLILAMFWLVFMIVQLFLAKNIYFLLGWLIVGGLNFINLVYRYWMPYLTLQDGLLIVHEFLNNSSIELSESTKIKKFAGDYIFKNNKKTLTVNTQLIEPTSLTALDYELGKFKIELE